MNLYARLKVDITSEKKSIEHKEKAIEAVEKEIEHTERQIERVTNEPTSKPTREAKRRAG
jgi:hypothetical protein